MIRVYLTVPALLAAAIAFAVVDRATSPSAAPSPTHVAAVFVDGLNSFDFRQVCSTLDPRQFPKVQDCEAYFAAGLESAAEFGMVGGYTVTAHSAKVWSQPYQGRSVGLATVEFTYGPVGGKPLVAHLRKTVHGWRIWFIT